MRNFVLVAAAACVLGTVVDVGWGQEGSGGVPDFFRDASESPHSQHAKATVSPEQAIDTYQSLAEKLKRPIDVEFVEVPLKDVVSYVADTLQVKIIIDAKSLEEAAIGVDTPVTISVKQMAARDFLRLMLKQLEIEIVRRGSFLEISTPRKLDAESEPRIYQARDLPGVDAEHLDVEQAVELIERMVEPSSWKANGGQGDIVHLRTILVIRQSPRVHDQIDDLLRQTREALAHVHSQK